MTGSGTSSRWGNGCTHHAPWLRAPGRCAVGRANVGGRGWVCIVSLVMTINRLTLAAVELDATRLNGCGSVLN